MGRPKKDKFDDLDKDFKEEAEKLDEGQLRTKISEIALNQEALMEAKEQDQDLAQKKEQAKEAGAVYREGSKANKLRVRYLRQMLDAKGKATGESGLEATAA